MVPDRAHLGGIGEHARGTVAADCVFGPAALPKLVDDLQELLRHRVAVVVGAQRLADASRRAGQIAGDDVPADPALGQVIERREPPRKDSGRLVGEIGGDTEAEVLGDQGHRGDEHHGVVNRHLNAVAQCGIGRVAVDVVGAEHVSEEHRVEAAALQQLRQLGPVGQRHVVRGAIVGMAPQAGRLVRDAVHHKGVEDDFTRHRQSVPVRGGALPFSQ